MLVFVTSLWVTEAIPYFVTALLIPVLVVLMNVMADSNGSECGVFFLLFGILVVACRFHCNNYKAANNCSHTPEYGSIHHDFAALELALIVQSYSSTAYFACQMARGPFCCALAVSSINIRFGKSDNFPCVLHDYRTTPRPPSFHPASCFTEPKSSPNARYTWQQL